jgi:hypothetical protein
MERKSLTEVAEVVEHLGGTHVVALLTRRSTNNVRNWIALGRFSAPTFLILSKALRRKGADAPPSLWGIEECRRKSRAA